MIDKILNIEQLEYQSNLKVQDFKNKLDTIFNQKSLKYNLSGKFKNDYEFKATDKWTIGIYINSFENDPAYLYGKIKETSNGIIINVTVRPNSIILIFVFLFPAIGIFTLFSTEFGRINENGLIVGLMFILFGIIFHTLGRLLKNRLRNKFEKYLDLSKLD